MMYDIDKIRSDFPILSREVNGKPLVYLDNGASAQKPQVVIDAVTQAYSMEYANVHRGLHYLSNLATEKYEAVRGTIARFLGVADENEIVFTSGTTEGINLVAYGWAMPRMEAGDEIVLTVAEHHANIVPWHFLRERQGVVLKWVEVDANGDLDPQAVIDAIGPKHQACCDQPHVERARHDLRRENGDRRGACAGGRGAGRRLAGGGAHAAGSRRAWRGFLRDHGPQALWSLGLRRDHIKRAHGRDAPLHGRRGHDPRGASRVVTWNDPPMKFEAGTPGIVQQIGLGVALDYMMEVGMDNIAAHEARLTRLCARTARRAQLAERAGKIRAKGAIFSFTIEGAGHAHDISTVLDKKGVAVRAGHHCAQPLMEHMGVNATCRASFAMYNTEAEVDALVDALQLCHELFA
jgi:cysteine desulfurase / selenocysteine lyase